VYVLPAGDRHFEDFQWIRTEIIDGGGDASICRAAFVDGLTDEEVRHLFHATRAADYREIADAARALQPAGRVRPSTGRGTRMARVPDEELAKLRKRLAAVSAIDFFDTPERARAQEAIDALAAALAPAREPSTAGRAGRLEPRTYRGRTWVTRSGVFVDRIASAWLIRRFIDRDARFRFVSGAQDRRRKGEVRFDMFEAEFTHEGDRCTFETLVRRFGLDEPALAAIAEVVHDIDLTDRKFARDDASGVERVLAGIAAAHADDVTRLALGAQVFDALYAAYSRTGETPAATRDQ
jgi:hypothetical protein